MISFVPFRVVKRRTGWNLVASRSMTMCRLQGTR